MDFFGLGWPEILLILIVALLIWGPNRIPEMAHKLGQFMSALRKASADLTTQMRKEMELEEKKATEKTKAAADAEKPAAPPASDTPAPSADVPQPAAEPAPENTPAIAPVKEQDEQ